MQIKRHLGKHIPSGDRVVVTYPLVPNTTEYALIVKVDRLGDSMKTAILTALEGNAGQAAVNFGEVLGRLLYGDSGKSIFQVLHENGALLKVSIDEVEMHPNPAFPLPLRTVLVESGILKRPATTTNTNDRFNPMEHNMKANETEAGMIQASNLLAEAKLLEQEMNKKREQAYTIYPSLRPVEQVTVEVPPVDPATIAAAFADETVTETVNDDQPA